MKGEYGKMRNKKSVLILQNCMEEAQNCYDEIKNEFDVICYTDDYDKAIEICKNQKPDFLITTLTLKKGDGIKIIEEAAKISPETNCVVLSIVSNSRMVQDAINAGAKYYMIKPADYSTFIKRMHMLYENEEGRELREQREIDERISRIFIGIGIPPHIKGYGYLREGVKLAALEPELMGSVTKRLYPMIGDRFNTSASKVERAIRHAIEVAWNKGRIDSFNALFGVRAYNENEKPTNSEFIALIADRLLLDGLS